MIIQPDPARSVAAALARVRSLPRQLRFAAAGAINDSLFAARSAEQVRMRQVFTPAPTPYVERGIAVRMAQREQLSGEVYADFWGRGKGVPPEKILLAEVFGGRRRAKRAEVALQRVGVLPPGWGMVPGEGAKPHMDAFGNVKGSFLVQLLSYLQAFGEQGYRANMTDKRRRALAKVGRSDSGARRIGGVEYFVSRGRGEFTGRGSWRGGQQQHLRAGIWQRSGTHGVDIKPVFLFVPLPRYRVRFDFHTVAAEAVAATLPARLSARLESALTTAR